MTTLYAVTGTGVLCGVDGPESYVNVKISGHISLDDPLESPEGKTYPMVAFHLKIKREKVGNVYEFKGSKENIYMTNYDNILTLEGEGYWKQWQFIEEADCSRFGYELQEKMKYHANQTFPSADDPSIYLSETELVLQFS